VSTEVIENKPWKQVARPKGFEPRTLCLEAISRCAISLPVLGFACFLHHDFAWYWCRIGPKLTQFSGTNLRANARLNPILPVDRFGHGYLPAASHAPFDLGRETFGSAIGTHLAL
jgi:hypothetical protein